ncbi:MAG: ThuA domain-containing protein [Ilumatobacteraceae bacterium]
MLRNLVLTGGWAHEFSVSSAVLTEILSPVAESVVVDDANDAAHQLNTGDFDVLTVYACWFTMTDPRYTAEQRAHWARTTPSDFRDAVARHLEAGRGLCVLHTGLLCFTDWEEWPDFVGGDWKWGRSWHPAPATMRVDRRVDAELHPIVAGINNLEVFDERYCDIEARSGSSVLMTSDGPEGEFPTVWVNETGGSRRTYSSLGHDPVSLTEPTHARLLRRMLVWAGGGDAASTSRIE